MKRRVVFISHTWPYLRCEMDFFDALRRRFELTFHDFSADPPVRLTDIADPDAVDAVVFFTRIGELRAAPPMDWCGFTGPRVLFDWDGFQEFTSLVTDSRRMEGRWCEPFHRNDFNLFLCSGARSEEHFASLGIPAKVLYKAYEPTRFRDLGLSRGGLCHFGSMYRSRQAMLRHLAAGRVSVTSIGATYEALNTELNHHLGVVMTTMGATVRLGKVGRGIERLRPGTMLRYEPSPEIMGKHFEAAGAGCAVFTDPTPDLDPLGFVDGKSVIVYQDFDDLVDRCRYFLERNDELMAIGHRGEEIVRERHTWDHRTVELEAALFPQH